MQEKVLEQKIWKLERDRKLEGIARKKIELERIRKEREVVDEFERKKQIEYEAVQEILAKQNRDNADIMKKAIQRADLLEKSVNASDINGE